MKTLEVRVKPNARVSALAPSTDGSPWRASLKSSPIDGKANAELIALVAAHFGIPKSAVTIRAGASGRTKLIRVQTG